MKRDRRRPLGRLPGAARPAQAGDCGVTAANAKARGGLGSAVGLDRRAAPRARRHPAAADDHEDVVMDGAPSARWAPQVELLLDAEPAPRAETPSTRPEAEFERLEALLSRFRPDSELSALNRRGAIDAGPDLVAVTDLALDGARADGRPLRPDRARRCRRRRLRPHVRRGRPETAAPSRPSRVRRRRDDRRDADRARARAPTRPRRDREGLRGRPRGAICSDRRSLPRQCGRRPRRSGGSWPVGVETRRPDHARARPGRARHLRPRPAPLAARRREPHHLIDPATGAAGRERAPARRPSLRRRRSRPRCSPNRSSSAARPATSPAACSSPPTAARVARRRAA